MHIKDEKIAGYLSDDILRERNRQWYLLYKHTLEKYSAELMGKKINFWIYLGDIPEIAYWAVKLNLIDRDRIICIFYHERD